MHQSIIEVFEQGLLTAADVAGRKVIEVGSCDVNGSVRPIVEALGPTSYLGVDGGPGPRVDRVLDCTALLAAFGPGRFDVVITTEMLEHVRDWETCVANLVGITVDGGLLVITTRSPGFPYHAFPEDHWRYPVHVMRRILENAGLDVLSCVPDPEPRFPGVVAKARKPVGWTAPSTYHVDGVEPMVRPLTVLGYPHQADGSGYYRYYLPYKHLARGTTHRILLPEPGTKFTPQDDELAEIDVIAGQRFMGPDGLMLWSRWAGKVRLVYETDDDILNPDNANGLAHMHGQDVRESFIRCIQTADMVTVSTEPLAEVMGQYNPTVRILPNYIDADLLYLDRPKAPKLTVGWAGGMSHLGDWMVAVDPLRDVLAANPDVDMHFAGIDYSPLLRRPCRYTPWKPDVWSYFKGIDFDIGLAPLADTQFNRCKSHLKALEYMALGIPVIASAGPTYGDMVVDGVTGFLVRKEDEWRDRLTDLINDEAMRSEMGAKGREAAGNWTIQQGWKLWRDAYEEVAGWKP